MECLLPYLCMVIVPRIMVRLERMLDYRGVRLERFHCSTCRCVRLTRFIAYMCTIEGQQKSECVRLTRLVVCIQ